MQLSNMILKKRSYSFLILIITNIKVEYYLRHKITIKKLIFDQEKKKYYNTENYRYLHLTIIMYVEIVYASSN